MLISNFQSVVAPPWMTHCFCQLNWPNTKSQTDWLLLQALAISNLA